MSLRPTPSNIPKSTQDLLDAAFEHELKKELEPLKYEINERINRLQSQEKDDEPPKRDIFGKSAWDYSMIKYKVTLGDLRDDLVGQLKLLRTLFHGLGPSVLDQKEEADRLKARIEANSLIVTKDKEDKHK